MNKIAPALKAYMNAALPVNQGGHVLALGEFHNQTANKDFLTEHITELADEHNVGLIAFELPIYLNVFLWAYRDGNLTVPETAPDGMDTTSYLRDMVCLLKDPSHAEASAFPANLVIKAIDDRKKLGEGKTLEIACFDTRLPLNQDIGPFSNKKLPLVVNSNQAYPAYNADSIVKDSYILSEAKKLLAQNPVYQTRLENLEAVIAAQQKWNKMRSANSTAGKTISYDALSAALVKAMLPEDAQGNRKNAITFSGLNHIIGIEDPLFFNNGTFEEHLKGSYSVAGATSFLSGLQVKPALAGNSAELREILGDNTLWYNFQDHSHPFHFPDILDVERDEVITSNVNEAEPDSVAALLIQKRNAYQRDYKELAEEPYPCKINLKEIKCSTVGIRECKAVKDALARVHKDYRAKMAVER